MVQRSLINTTWGTRGLIETITCRTWIGRCVHIETQVNFQKFSTYRMEKFQSKLPASKQAPSCPYILWLVPNTCGFVWRHTVVQCVIFIDSLLVFIDNMWAVNLLTQCVWNLCFQAHLASYPGSSPLFCMGRSLGMRLGSPTLEPRHSQEGRYSLVSFLM